MGETTFPPSWSSSLFMSLKSANYRCKVKQSKENVCVLSKGNKNGQGVWSPTMGLNNPLTH